jgi:hypothetical protein
VSALDGFYTVWSKARDTFGEGTPQTGDQFDASPQLSQAQATLDRAAPGSQWTGTGANAYGVANTQHQEVIGGIGALDKRLAAQVTYSAEVVAHGRTQLDGVRQWVTDAAASVPPGKDQDQKLLPIANRGIGEVVGIVQKTNSELGNVGGKIRALSAEYDKLGLQAFVPKEGTGDALGATGDKSEEEIKKRAEEDVKKTLLEGDEAAAGRVNDVLSKITPGQPLSAEQQAYLNEMQTQQHDMSVDELTTAEERLSEHKNVIGDSWQLMSNDDVAFGKPDASGNQPKGSFDRLPESVQRALSNDNLIGYPGDELERQKVEAIADIVRNGDSKFQDGTEIDREMIRLSDRLMDESPANQETVRDLFTSAGRDHQVVTDHMVGWQPETGRYGYDYNSDDFLNDVMTTGWADDGKDAATLFSWTNEEAGSHPDIASAAAERYATFLGSHPELMDIPSAVPGMTDTLGQVNPELVKGMAHGLTPYMADIANVEGGANDNFQPLDHGKDSQDRNLAKGVFTVLGSQVDAYREFYGAANEMALNKSYEWANKVGGPEGVFPHDASMNGAASLKALMDHGTAEGLKTIGMDNNEMTDLKRSVYNQAVDALSAAGGPYGKAIGVMGGALEDSFFGNGSDISGDVVPMYADESARFATNALLATGAEVPGTEQFQIQDFDKNGQPYQRLMTTAELEARNIYMTPDQLGGDLNEALDKKLGLGRSPVVPFGEQYDRITQ